MNVWDRRLAIAGIVLNTLVAVETIVVFVAMRAYLSNVRRLEQTYSAAPNPSSVEDIMQRSFTVVPASFCIAVIGILGAVWVVKKQKKGLILSGGLFLLHIALGLLAPAFELFFLTPVSLFFLVRSYGLMRGSAGL